MIEFPKNKILLTICSLRKCGKFLLFDENLKIEQTFETLRIEGETIEDICPLKFAADQKKEMLYLSHGHHFQIIKIDKNFNFVKKTLFKPNHQYNFIRGLCFDNKNNHVYASDYNSRKIEIFTNDLNYLKSISLGGYVPMDLKVNDSMICAKVLDIANMDLIFLKFYSLKTGILEQTYQMELYRFKDQLISCYDSNFYEFDHKSKQLLCYKNSNDPNKVLIEKIVVADLNNDITPFNGYFICFSDCLIMLCEQLELNIIKLKLLKLS